MRQFFSIASGKAGLRSLLASRTIAWLVVGVFVVTVLFKVALPLFVSTASVKVNMERALSSWTGARARIGGNPDISFWPHPVLTLNTVTFEGGDAATPELLAKADAIAAGFDILAALRGSPVFSDFRLVNPVFHVERRVDGSFNWRRAGWMADAIAAAGTPRSAVGNTPIGDIEIENGRLELVDRIMASAHSIGGISGSVEWPAPTAQMSANLTAMINGQKVEWSLTSAEPITLLSGRNSAIETSFRSAPLSFSFDGMANGSAYPFASGQLLLTAISIPALSAWYGADVPPTGAGETFAIETSLTISGESLKMDNLSLSLDGSRATGVLDIAWKRQPNPRIDGTLAFDRLDLKSTFESLSPLLSASKDQPGALDLAFLRKISLDLRLSSEQASYGAFALTDVAAGVMAENGRASIDIGGAGYSGGSLSGRIALAKDGADGGQVQFSLRNADLAPVVDILGLKGPLPIGAGTLSVDLATTEPLPALTASAFSGEVRYTASDGMLTNFNMDAFERLARERGSFTIDQAAGGSFAFATAEIVAKLQGSVAELTKADIRADGRTLSLAGTIPQGSGLALSGTIRPDDAALQPIRFLMGGFWPNPLISPFPAMPAPQ